MHWNRVGINLISNKSASSSSLFRRISILQAGNKWYFPWKYLAFEWLCIERIHLYHFCSAARANLQVRIFIFLPIKLHGFVYMCASLMMANRMKAWITIRIHICWGKKKMYTAKIENTTNLSIQKRFCSHFLFQFEFCLKYRRYAKYSMPAKYNLCHF